MTTEEFVEALNAIDDVVEIKATVNGHGDILLRVFDEDEDVPLEIAILKRHAFNWGILATSLVVIPTRILKLMVEMAESRKDDTFTMSPSLLRLMAELAETPAEERTEANKETNKMTTKEWKEALKLINCFDSISYTLAGILFEHYFGKGNKYSAQLFKLHDDLIHMKGEFHDQLKRECPDVFLADLFDGEDDIDNME